MTSSSELACPAFTMLTPASLICLIGSVNSFSDMGRAALAPSCGEGYANFDVSSAVIGMAEPAPRGHDPNHAMRISCCGGCVSTKVMYSSVLLKAVAGPT